MASALGPAATRQLFGQQRRLLHRNLAPLTSEWQETTTTTSTTTSTTAIPPASQPASGTAEFEDGSGVALFRPPASLPPLKRQAPGKPGVAEFVAGGKAAFASRLGSPSPLDSLRRYGLAGVLSYGILNTLWYAFFFATAWLYVAQVPKGAGLVASAKAAGKVFALAWAGSQVTKAARIGAAALGAPLADTLIDWIRKRMDLPTRRAAFGVAVTCCATVATAVVGGFVVAWV